MKQLKELQNFSIDLEGNIDDIIENPAQWAEEFAEKAIIAELPRYRKAKKLGEDFANEITD